jgi:uncharacterized protein YdgA (DUF945 family)
VTYSLGGSILKTLRAGGHGDWADHTQFTVRNTIHHGPLPQLRAFAPATVDTQMVLSPQVREKLAAALGNKGGFTVHTRMKWLGGGTTIVTSTPFQIETPGGGAFSWRGAHAQIEYGRDYGSQSITFDSPGFSLQNRLPNVDSAGLLEVTFGSLKLDTDTRLAFDALHVGTTHLALAELAIVNPAKDFKLTLQGLSLDSKAQVSGEYVDTEVILGTGPLQAPKFAATRLNYDAHVDHVHGPSGAALMRALRSAQIETATTSSLRRGRAEDAGSLPDIRDRYSVARSGHRRATHRIRHAGWRAGPFPQSNDARSHARGSRLQRTDSHGDSREIPAGLGRGPHRYRPAR